MLSVQSSPAGASLWVDGERRGVTPLRTSASAGSHKIVLELAGRKLVHKDISVEASGTELVQDLETAKPTAGTGGLKVRCRTLGELRIFVDDNDTGLTCPNDERISVEPGKHAVGLFSPRTGEMKIVEGEIDDDVDHSTRIYTKY